MLFRSEYDADKKEVTLQVEQLQPQLFNFPFEFCFTPPDSLLCSSTERRSINDRITTITLPLPFRPEKLIADPELNMLVDYTILPLVKH